MDTTLIKSELKIKSELIKLKALILSFAKGPEKNYNIRQLDNSISDEEKPTSIAKKLFQLIRLLILIPNCPKK